MHSLDNLHFHKKIADSLCKNSINFIVSFNLFSSGHLN